MNENLQLLLNEAVEEMLNKVSSDKKYQELLKKHNDKVHFVPLEYRVFGGQLQSLNIQFGNFLEHFMVKIIESDKKYEIIEEYSGKRSNSFLISAQNDELIDRYIADCQQNNFSDLNGEFNALMEQILINNRRTYDMRKFNHDIDILFKDTVSGKKYYIEVKYQDDHDSGKFVDINRKFIKTYAYLTSELDITESEELVPILFYFNPARNIGNIYVPEDQYILRGPKFFEQFFSDITYEDVRDLFLHTSQLNETRQSFDNLYETTMTIVEETKTTD